MMEASSRRRQTGRTPAISFEFFPPKDDEQASMLEETILRLACFRPSYVSVTYGAGGTSQQRSRGAVARMQGAGFRTAAHLTCAGASAADVEEAIDGFRAGGIESFV